jgi:hypothetical protein
LNFLKIKTPAIAIKSVIIKRRKYCILTKKVKT